MLGFASAATELSMTSSIELFLQAGSKGGNRERHEDSRMIASEMVEERSRATAANRSKDFNQVPAAARPMSMRQPVFVFLTPEDEDASSIRKDA